MSLPAIELSVLAFWLGGAVLTAAVVAPAAFAVLPSRTLAGNMVGQVLPVIFYSGIVVGVLVIGLETADNDGWHWGTPVVFGGLVAVACAIAQFVVGSRIESVRMRIGGSVDALAPGGRLIAIHSHGNDPHGDGFHLCSSSLGGVDHSGKSQRTIALLDFFSVEHQA